MFPKDISEPMLELYETALRGYDIDRIELACLEIIKTKVNNYFPSSGEIRAAIHALPVVDRQQILQTTTQTVEDKQRAGETGKFYIFESKRHRRGIHPDNVETWNTLMEEFRLEHDLTDKRAAELIAMRRKHGYNYLQNDPNFFGDEGLYVQFGKWATLKNKTFVLGQPEKSYLSIVKEYITGERIKDQKSMGILIKLLSTKRQGALTR
jgi:hypothetical protein